MPTKFSRIDEGGRTAVETTNTEDKTIEKAVWHYVGVTVLWASLFLTGMALERLGLTSWILASVVPGEVGSLRAQAAECDKNLGTVKLERDNIKHEEAGLRVEIKKLQDQVVANQK